MGKHRREQGREHRMGHGGYRVVTTFIFQSCFTFYDLFKRIHPSIVFKIKLWTSSFSNHNSKSDFWCMEWLNYFLFCNVFVPSKKGKRKYDYHIYLINSLKYDISTHECPLKDWEHILPKPSFYHGRVSRLFHVGSESEENVSDGSRNFLGGGGTNSQSGCANLFFGRKLHERIWIHGGRVPGAPLDSPLKMSVVWFEYYLWCPYQITLVYECLKGDLDTQILMHR